MTHVDLHLHLLPGVDDGPADLTGSLEHAARMAADGVHEATVTPHVGHPDFPLDLATVAMRTALLQRALDDAGIELLLHPGGELHPEGAAGLDRAELELIAHGPRGARWLLLEVPFAGIDAAFVATCRRLRGHGFGLVIGHPERAAGLLEDGLGLLRPVIADGALLQVNACSLLGRHGPAAQEAAERLVRDGHAYILASDGHGGTARGHTLADGALAAIAAGVSPGRARSLTETNPWFLLRHGIPRAPVGSESAGRPWLAPEVEAPPVPRAVGWRSPNERRMRAALAAARER